ncbi:MAG: hypothetical protein FJY73_11170 [Candidatus Eisenbacteria bacterium]|nr:hypothetical protein [Candidatus Eisenbacteria bacterium]
MSRSVEGTNPAGTPAIVKSPLLWSDPGFPALSKASTRIRFVPPGRFGTNHAKVPVEDSFRPTGL